jgi:hypothetical protein
LEAKIFPPREGARRPGAFDVIGSGAGENATVTLEVGAGEEPSGWTFLNRLSGSVRNGVLSRFDPERLNLPDGRYTLRLSVSGWRSGVSETVEDKVSFLVDFVDITSPIPPRLPGMTQVFKPGASIPIRGKATSPRFRRFQAEWVPGVVPDGPWSSEGMVLSGGGAAPVQSGELARWNTGFLAASQAGYYTLRVTVQGENGFETTGTTTVYLEPDLLAVNWPRTLAGVGSGESIIPLRDAGGAFSLTVSGTYGGYAVHPGENLITSGPTNLYSFTPTGVLRYMKVLKLGSWIPAGLGLRDGAASDLVASDIGGLQTVRWDGANFAFASAPGTLFQMAPILVEDVDGDPAERETLAIGEHFFPGPPGVKLYGFRNGVPLSSHFPIDLEMTGVDNAARLVAADIDGDARKEILVVDGDNAGGLALKLYDWDGAPRRVPLLTLPEASLVQAGAADLDADGSLEFVLYYHDRSTGRYTLAVVGPEGNFRPGWPVPLESEPGFDGYKNFAVGDLDKDGKPEIAASALASLHILKGDGTPFGSWPLHGNGNQGFGRIALGDLDGDTFPEILTARQEFSWVPAPEPFSTQAIPAASGMAPPAGLNHDSVSSLQTLLLAYRRDQSLFKSWNLLTNAGDLLYGNVTPLIGDVDRNGRVDIAYTSNLSDPTPTATIGRPDKVLGVFSLPSPTTNNPWPTIYRDASNNPVLPGSDRTPPVVVWVSPAPGSVLSRTVSLRAEARDSGGVAGVQFLVDGTKLGAEDLQAPYAVSWNTLAAANGTHTLTAMARDRTGNTRTTAKVLVRVQNQTPRRDATVVWTEGGTPEK